jgi:hypothetical protein
MQCRCCDREVKVVRKVKLRTLASPFFGDTASALDALGDGGLSGCRCDEYRWSFVCPGCYHTLDNEYGIAAISGSLFNIAGASRRDRARTLNEAMYNKQGYAEWA